MTTGQTTIEVVTFTHEDYSFSYEVKVTQPRTPTRLNPSRQALACIPFLKDEDEAIRFAAQAFRAAQANPNASVVEIRNAARY